MLFSSFFSFIRVLRNINVSPICSKEHYISLNLGYVSWNTIEFSLSYLSQRMSAHKHRKLFNGTKIEALWKALINFCFNISKHCIEVLLVKTNIITILELDFPDDKSFKHRDLSHNGL